MPRLAWWRWAPSCFTRRDFPDWGGRLKLFCNGGVPRPPGAGSHAIFRLRDVYLREAGRMRSDIAQPSPSRAPSSFRAPDPPSYESFLRIKQGVGGAALRAAGLPTADQLSYDAYAAALRARSATRGLADVTELKPRARAPSRARAPAKPGAARGTGRSGMFIFTVGLGAAFVAGMLLNEMRRDARGPAMPTAAAPIVIAAAAPRAPTGSNGTIAAIAAPAPSVALADRVPRPSPVAGMVELLPAPAAASASSPVPKPVALPPAVLPPIVSSAATTPRTLLPKAKPAAADEATPVIKKKPRVKAAQSPPKQARARQPAFWDSIADFFASGDPVGSEKAGSQRWQSRTEDR